MTDHPIEPADKAKPPVYEAVRVWLEDGTKVAAIWTGELWWAQGQELKPVQWQRMTRNTMVT